jgi:protein phosphatase
MTDPGRQRDRNEDAFWVPGEAWPPLDQLATKGALCLAIDGMGGHRAGDVASRMATDHIPRAYYADPDPDRAAALRRAVEGANAQIFQAAQESPSQGNMGATLVAAVVSGRQLIVAHAGDSRAYLLRGRRIHRLTEDHSWVSERLKSGILTLEEAVDHPLGNIITRALGNKPEIEPKVTTGVMGSEDTLLLCTDGLWGSVEEREIARILCTRPPRQAVELLVQAANDAGGPDNITVVIVAAST